MANSIRRLPCAALACAAEETVPGVMSGYRHASLLTMLQLSAYAIDYELDLFSNFTYFLDDEVEGDQFEQVDDRLILGGKAGYRFGDSTEGRRMSHRIGGDWRYDMIDEVALYRTRAQQRLGPVRSDEVDEWSVGLFYENEMAWTASYPAE